MTATIEILKTASRAAATDVLLDAVLLIEAQTTTDEAERLTRAAMLGVIEERHPEIADAIDAWAEGLDERTYGEAVRDALAA